MAWALGGIFEQADRQLFHDYLQNKGAPLPQKTPDQENVFDFFVNPETFQWRPCIPDEFKPPEKGVV